MNKDRHFLEFNRPLLFLFLIDLRFCGSNTYLCKRKYGYQKDNFLKLYGKSFDLLNQITNFADLK